VKNFLMPCAERHSLIYYSSSHSLLLRSSSCRYAPCSMRYASFPHGSSSSKSSWFPWLPAHLRYNGKTRMNENIISVLLRRQLTLIWALRLSDFKSGPCYLNRFYFYGNGNAHKLHPFYRPSRAERQRRIHILKNYKRKITDSSPKKNQPAIQAISTYIRFRKS